MIVIGISGGSASGKTSIAMELMEAFPNHRITLLRQDDYYKDLSHLSFEERTKVNFDHPNAFDLDLLVENVRDLKAGKGITKPLYDFKEHNRKKEWENVSPSEVLIIEGLFVLYHPALREACDLCVYIDAMSDIRLIRRLQRDVLERGRSMDSIISQYLATVKPMHDAFVEPSKAYAHIIIPIGVENRVGVDVLITKIRSILQ